VPITVKDILVRTGRSVILLALCLFIIFWSLCGAQDSAYAGTDAPTAAALGAGTQGVAAAPQPELSATGSEVRMDGAGFALSGVVRMNKGTNKAYNGSYYGYRYPMPSADAFVLLVLSERQAVVYLPASAPKELGQSDGQAAFQAMILALDEGLSSGGTRLSSMELDYRYLSEPSVDIGGYRYRFGLEVEPGYYYASITEAGSGGSGSSGGNGESGIGVGGSGDGGSSNNSGDGSNGALFCLSGQIVAADSVAIVQPKTGLAAFIDFLTGIDLRPFWVSLRTSAVAMLFVFVLGLLAAWFSQHISNRLKGVLDAILTIPLVLPPTVCGFLLLVLFGNSTAVGRWLIAHGIELIFSWPAAVLAAVIVSFPLMYRTARGAFEALDPALGDAARTLGWSEQRVFLKLTLPLSWPSIAAGTVLAFARAMGEFGATLFVAGNYPGVTQTMPIAIYFEWMGGHSDVATFWVVVVILFSFVVILFVNWYAAHTQRYRRASSDAAEDVDKDDIPDAAACPEKDDGPGSLGAAAYLGKDDGPGGQPSGGRKS
jgi:molybdate transport system permease protein